MAFYVESGYIDSGYFEGDILNTKDLTGSLTFRVQPTGFLARLRTISGAISAAISLASIITKVKRLIGDLTGTLTLTVTELFRQRQVPGDQALSVNMDSTYTRERKIQGDVSFDFVLLGTLVRRRLIQGALSFRVILSAFIRKIIAPVTVSTWSGFGRTLTKWNTPSANQIDKISNDPKLPINADSTSIRRHMYDLHAKYIKVINELVDINNQDK